MREGRCFLYFRHRCFYTWIRLDGLLARACTWCKRIIIKQTEKLNPFSHTTLFFSLLYTYIFVSHDHCVNISIYIWRGGEHFGCHPKVYIARPFAAREKKILAHIYAICAQSFRSIANKINIIYLKFIHILYCCIDNALKSLLCKEPFDLRLEKWAKIYANILNNPFLCAFPYTQIFTFVGFNSLLARACGSALFILHYFLLFIFHLYYFAVKKKKKQTIVVARLSQRWKTLLLRCDNNNAVVRWWRPHKFIHCDCELKSVYTIIRSADARCLFIVLCKNKLIIVVTTAYVYTSGWGIQIKLKWQIWTRIFFYFFFIF